MVSYEDLTEEQQRAVAALDRNVTLTAGAGTGKTTTLTARYLAMIEESLARQPDGGDNTDVDQLLPENILTTTFTERAANDLEASVRTEITDRVASLDVDEFDAWRTVADELEYGYIHTLHGFCARLLREHALTIESVDPGFETLDENETSALIHDTVGTVLEEHENHESIRALARQFSRGQLKDVLTDLLGERPESIEWAKRWVDATEDEYLSYVESALHPIDPDVAAECLAHPKFVDATRTLIDIVEHPPNIDTGGQTWSRAEGVVARLDSGFDDGVPSRAKQTTIAELGMHLTTGDGERYAGYTGAKSRWDSNPRKEEFDTAFETLVETLRPEEHAVNVDLELEANSFPFVQALAELTLLAYEAYEEQKDRQNAVDFSDLLTYTVEFLDNPENSEIRNDLRAQFEYVMVDEFQDTDLRQWDLITLLTATDGATFDAENVFVVGDVKQSIYRFRNADVTQFRETAETLDRTARDGVTDDEIQDDDRLSTNFRTLPTVLETINELFEAVFDEDGEPYEAAPQSLTAAREDPVNLGSVEYLAVPTDPDLRAHRFDHYPDFATAEPGHDAELEAQALAARLSQMLAEPLQIYPENRDEEGTADGENESETDRAVSTRQTANGGMEHPEPRNIEPSDIAILIRSRTHLKKYEHALEDADVPYSVASGIGFYESTEITALVNLLRALADPSNERALYATLRSPLFGATDDTLAQLKLDGESLWKALGASEHEELATCYESLQTWRHRAGADNDGPAGFDGSWAAFLTEILEDTGYLVSVSADERPRQAMANVEKFREQLRGWSDDGVRSLTTLVNSIERRMELGDRESEADTTDEGVQILTVHDSKGMEFPVVVVPGIGRGFKDQASIGGGQVEFEQMAGQHAVGLKAPSQDDLFDMQDTIAREAIRDQRRAEERAEEKRVLYVACTRARDHLLLSSLHDSEGEAPEPTMTDLEESDSEEASSWRDWVQPEFLGEGICEALDEDEQVQRDYGDGTYTVSLPTPPAEQDQADSNHDPELELSPQPPVSEIDFRLSATDLAALLGEYGELRIDEETRTAYVEEKDEVASSPDSRHGEDSPTARDGHQVEGAASESDADTGEVSARVFGEMVHRLCELRPPETHWPHLVEQTLVDEGATATLTPELQNRVSTHAQRGMDYVDEYTTDVDVEHQYDELYVTAEFEHGEISGFIDHLIVTPDAYHIIDYKTGNVTPEELGADAEYYKNQMKAYAVALHQQGTGRAVRVSLFFTSLEDAWEVEWSPENVRTIKDEIETEIVDRSQKRPPY